MLDLAHMSLEFKRSTLVTVSLSRISRSNFCHFMAIPRTHFSCQKISDIEHLVVEDTLPEIIIFMDTNILPSLRPLYMETIVNVAPKRATYQCSWTLNYSGLCGISYAFCIDSIN